LNRKFSINFSKSLRAKIKPNDSIPIEKPFG
jgi:hypothetical protein